MANLDAQIEEFRRKLNTVHSQGTSTSEELLQDLQTTLEELQTASEEIQEQNENLISGRRDLEEEHQRYQDLFEFAPVSYVVTDMLGTIMMANKTCEDLLSVKASLAHKLLVTFVPLEDRQRFRSLVNGLRNEDVLNRWELRLNAEGGAVRSVVASVRVTRGPDGAPASLLWALLDVSEQNRAREQVRKLSTPILRLAERILVVPIIGDMDSARTKQLCNDVLQAIATSHARVAIVDLTGAVRVGGNIGASLTQLVRAVRFLGADLIITGIGGDMAQVMVDEGVPPPRFLIAADLQSGVEMADTVLNGGGG